MGNRNTTRILLAVALIAGMLGVNATAALADGKSGIKDFDLNDRFEGWFSNGMVNDPEACGSPHFEASEDAVVWHMFVDLPAGADAEIKDVDVKSGGNVTSRSSSATFATAGLAPSAK